MEILRVAGDLYPDSVGGYGIHVHEMSLLQAKMGNEVTVFTTFTNNNVKEEYKYGYKIMRYKPLITLYGNAFLPSMLVDLIKMRKKFDIIHAHSHLFMSTNLCAVARKLGSSPLVITNHGFESQSVPDWVNSTYNATVAKWNLNTADRIICYTENDREKMINVGVKPEKIAIIHNGINTDVFYPLDTQRDRKNNLLWIGRFVRGKGVGYLIEAMALLVKDYPDLRLLLIGNGPEKENIERMIEDLGLRDNVTIKNFVSNSEIPDIYRSSDIFVLPSLYEGVPRTILEAMSCGVPVVCSGLPQLTDIVSNCGYLTRVKDPQAIADSIGKLLSRDDVYREFCRNGRAKVLNNYSWEDTVKETLKLYESLIM